MNRRLLMLSRVVIHPTFRSAGVAADFIRRSCELSGYPWIETLTQMGHINRFFERAGFVRVGKTAKQCRTRKQHSAIYGASGKRGRLLTQETFEKSRYAEPIYYIFDNRRTAKDACSTPAE